MKWKELILAFLLIELYNYVEKTNKQTKLDLRVKVLNSNELQNQNIIPNTHFFIHFMFLLEYVNLLWNKNNLNIWISYKWEVPHAEC